MSDWLLHLEQWSSPHFMRGALLGWAVWLAGLWWWPKKAVWVSFLIVALFSFGWEIRDQLYSLMGKSDPFDLADMVFDLLGCAFVQLVHWTTHKWDKG